MLKNTRLVVCMLALLIRFISFLNRKIFLFLLIFLIIFNFLLDIAPLNVNANANYSKISELDEKLKNLRQERDRLNQNIKDGQVQQSTLEQQKRLIENQIRQTEVQIELLEVEIEKATIQLEFLNQEKHKLKNRLNELQNKLQDSKNSLKYSLNLLYKYTINDYGFLNENTTFENIVLSEEKQRSLIRITKVRIDEIKDLTQQLEQKYKEIAQKELELSNLKASLDAKYENLEMQVRALNWQRNNKDNLINKVKQDQIRWEEEIKRYTQEMLKIEQEKARLISQVLDLPPSNVYVEAGQVIGFQGRTGLSCQLYDPRIAPVRTNTWCQEYGGTSSDYYYYDPDKFPSFGSHLHFEYRINGVAQDPYPYLFGNKKSEFKSMPLTPMYFSRGFHYNGIDIYAYHGAPVYAVKSGYVSYYCLNYPADQNFKDPLYFAVIKHVDENGNFDGTSSLYLHIQRNGRPCNYVPGSYAS